MALTDIEANRFAQIQLMANSLHQPTEDSFRKAVTLDYQHYTAKKGFTEEFPMKLRSPNSEIRKWIDARVAAGEQIAFLSYSRNDAKMMQDAMAEVYPGKHIASLVSDKVYDSNAFSNYIKKYWNDVLAVGYQSAAFTVATQIVATLNTRGKNPKAIQAMELGVRNMVSEWWKATTAEEASWKHMVSINHITEDQYFENLRDSLLAYEINHNSIRQRVINMRNKDRKQADMEGNPDMIVGTVHSAKGLEFPHVIVIHNYDNQMEESMKRLYYVAFTRAQVSEYVASYGTVKNSKIEADYINHVEILRKRDSLNILRAQGMNLDAMSEDEVGDALAELYNQKEAAKQAAEDAANGDGDTADTDATEADEKSASNAA